MAKYQVSADHESYPVVVERGVLARLPEFLPAGSGRIFVVTTKDVWKLHGDRFSEALGKRGFETLFFPVEKKTSGLRRSSTSPNRCSKKGPTDPPW